MVTVMLILISVTLMIYQGHRIFFLIIFSSFELISIAFAQLHFTIEQVLWHEMVQKKKQKKSMQVGNAATGFFFSWVCVVVFSLGGRQYLVCVFTLL